MQALLNCALENLDPGMLTTGIPIIKNMYIYIKTIKYNEGMHIKYTTTTTTTKIILFKLKL